MSSDVSLRSKLPSEPIGWLGLALLAFAAVSVVLSFIDDWESATQALINGLSNGALYALIALGYTMVYGIIELINFAHGDLFMLCSVVGAVLIEDAFGKTASSPAAWLVFAIVMVFTMAFGAGANMTIERLAYRRLRNAPKLAPLITAVGVSFILQNIGLLDNIFGQDWNGSAPRSRERVLSTGSFSIGDIEIAYITLIVILITAPLLLAMTWLVQRTRTGKAMRATAQDRDASSLMGINVDRMISYTFGLGGALAGAAGIMAVQAFGNSRYDAGFRLGLIAFTAAVLGGVGNLLGAVVGGILIGILQALNEAKKIFPPSYPDWIRNFTGGGWSQTVTFTVLILMIIFRPQGIFGAHQQEKV